jgi:hypothetical protein
MYEKTVTVKGTQYKVVALTVDQGDEIYSDETLKANSLLRLRWIVMHSLNNGGIDPQLTQETTGKLPMPLYNALRSAALEVNEMMPEKQSAEIPSEATAASTA